MAVIWSRRETEPERLSYFTQLLDGVWVEDEDVVFDPAAETVTVSFEQAPGADLEERPEFSNGGRTLIRETAWFDEYKRPTVRCSLVVHEALGMTIEDPELNLLFEVEYSEADRRIELRCDPAGRPVEIPVRRVDVELRMTDEIVGWERFRVGRGIGWESVAPWRDEA
ncbi:MAG: hypothetical protein QOD53_2131 [Thermoleophilaceae bacterium]|jgi:hypothetical protein|nr:hypothetical protein [Thermoleophilaceae bacterium]